MVTHYGAITDPSKVGELLRAIDGYEGQGYAASVDVIERLAKALNVVPASLLECLEDGSQ